MEPPYAALDVDHDTLDADSGKTRKNVVVSRIGVDATVALLGSVYRSLSSNFGFLTLVDFFDARLLTVSRQWSVLFKSQFRRFLEEYKGPATPSEAVPSSLGNPFFSLFLSECC